MKCKLYILMLLSVCIMVFTSAVSAEDRWQSGFDASGEISGVNDSVLTLNEVLSLVAAQNPSLQALGFMREAAQGNLKQAGVWKNPEFSTEFEEVGWDAPGLSESEITISLSQEFEFFGQRKARQEVAKSDIKSVDFETKLLAFDLYLEVKSRFNKLLHSQKRGDLADISVVLAENIVKSIEYRSKQGVALQSELLLAQLEYQRAKITSDVAKQELHSAQLKLVSLWNSDFSNITVQTKEEPDFQSAMKNLSTLLLSIDSTRYVQQLNFEQDKIRAERLLSTVEAKPGITLSGGYKRIEVDNSNSFLFGLSLPLPFLDKNQGRTASLDASLRSLEFEQERIRIESKAHISATISQINQLINQHVTLDTLLLPTAELAFKTLHEAYNVGRIPYTIYLEAERSLIDLRFEHNDILFAIHEQLIAIEQISGIRIDE